MFSRLFLKGNCCIWHNLGIQFWRMGGLILPLMFIVFDQFADCNNTFIFFLFLNPLTVSYFWSCVRSCFSTKEILLNTCDMFCTSGKVLTKWTTVELSMWSSMKGESCKCPAVIGFTILELRVSHSRSDCSNEILNKASVSILLFFRFVMQLKIILSKAGSLTLSYSIQFCWC